MNLKSKKAIMGIAGLVVAFGFAMAPVIASASTYTFNTNLTVGSKGTDVMNLQKVLNSSTDTQVASGVSAGAPGHETSTFGPATKAAVIKWQAKNGITPTSGYVGPITRAKLNGTTVSSTTNTTTTTTTTTSVVGGSLVFTAVTQPANSLAPAGAARVPFTTFTLSNTGTNVATVNGITVQRTGLAQDAVFSGIVLVDANNVQIGTSKTFNSNHQTTVGDTFTINPGETKTLTVAGNMASNLNGYAGQVVSISVVGVNSSATVSGSFPVSGAQQTINATLSLGSVSTSTSSFDPGATQQRNIGDTGVRISGIKFTANSAEDLKIYSLRWRQVGTASASDISNVVTYVNGTAYPAVVSTDGKYYTTVFSGGILIPKGNSIDVYATVDMTGTNSASRTVELDIDKVTDVYFVGQLYGYGIAPSGTFQPWFKGYAATINAGTVTTIAKANEVAAQNIASNVPNQVLGGFATNFAGENVTTNSMVFSVATSSSIGGLLTSVSLVDSNGAVVAGPVDATWTGGNNNPELITFTDTVTFTTGRHVYTLKGKVPSGATNGATITLSTTPSSWGNVTGQTSGNTISIGTGNFSMNAVTVKAAALTVNVSTQPTSQNIVAGIQNLVLANYQLDASQSGEDIRLSSFPVYITTVGTNSAGDLSGCAIWDGTTQLGTGSRVINTITSATKANFLFDNSLVISKGTIKTLTLTCNVTSSPANTTDTYQVTNGTLSSSADYAITGVTSGNTVGNGTGLTLGTSNGGTMSLTTASLALSVDQSSPSYSIQAGGTTGVTVAKIKLRASNESVNLTKLGLQLTTGSSTDVVNTYVYQGSTLLGTATFTGNNTIATSTFTSPLALAKDTDTILTISADLAPIGTSQSGTEGKFIKIDPANAQGTGLSSGSTINASSTAGSNVAGIRAFHSYPIIAIDSLPAGTGADGRLIHFKVTASSAGPVGIQQMTFNIATTVSTVSNVGLYAYTDVNYSSGISGQGNSGQIGSNITLAYPGGNGNTNGANATSTPTSVPIQVPAGTTYYFELRGSVTGGGTTGSVVTKLLGDAAYPANNNPVDIARGYFVATSSALTAAGESTGANFIWSGNATSTSSTSDVDWSNGYGILGLPSSGLIQSRSN